MEAHLNVSLVQPFVDPDNDCVVDQVEEEEVEEHGFADLWGWFFDGWIGGGVPDNWMSANPREQLIHISEALTSQSIAQPQDDNDDSWSSHDGAVDIECGDNRDGEEAEDNLEKQINFHPEPNLIFNMRHKSTRWLDVQIIPQEDPLRIIQNLISNQVIKIKHQWPKEIDLLQHYSVVCIS